MKTAFSLNYCLKIETPILFDLERRENISRSFTRSFTTLNKNEKKIDFYSHYFKLQSWAVENFAELLKNR